MILNCFHKAQIPLEERELLFCAGLKRGTSLMEDKEIKPLVSKVSPNLGWRASVGLFRGSFETLTLGGLASLVASFGKSLFDTFGPQSLGYCEVVAEKLPRIQAFALRVSADIEQRVDSFFPGYYHVPYSSSTEGWDIGKTLRKGVWDSMGWLFSFHHSSKEDIQVVSEGVEAVSHAYYNSIWYVECQHERGELEGVLGHLLNGLDSLESLFDRGLAWFTNSPYSPPQIAVSSHFSKWKINFYDRLIEMVHTLKESPYSVPVLLSSTFALAAYHFYRSLKDSGSSYEAKALGLIQKKVEHLKGALEKLPEEKAQKIAQGILDSRKKFFDSIDGFALPSLTFEAKNELFAPLYNLARRIIKENKALKTS